MTKKLRIFLLLFFSLVLSGLVVYNVAAQQDDWVVYHGDFASFQVCWDYNLDFKKSGGTFTYFIEDPKFPGEKLLISYSYMQMDFKLPKKHGYKTQVAGPIQVANATGVERRGVTGEERNWREAYIYYSTRGAMGPDTRLIYVMYDDAPGELSQNFNRIINSIEVKDPLQVEITPKFP